jgi:hypothetical protein
LNLRLTLKHKHINRSLRLIEESYERLLSGSYAKLKQVELFKKWRGGGEEDSGRERDVILKDIEIQSQEEPEMLVDPSSNVPLKIYALPVSKLNKLADDPTWVPPVKLTREEEHVVRHAGQHGATLLLGRSGTGKTYCVTSRMCHDRHASQTSLRQLFIARNKTLCDTVRVLQVSAGEDVSRATFAKPEELMGDILATIRDRADAHVGERADYLPKHRVAFDVFKRRVWRSINRKQHRSSLDPLQVWTQIRSFIKGSYEAAKECRPLRLEEYLGIAPKRCRLNEEKRRLAYQVFESYQAYLVSEGLWDDMDRTMELVQHLLQGGDSSGALEMYYHKIYLDEVQV